MNQIKDTRKNPQLQLEVCASEGVLGAVGIRGVVRNSYTHLVSVVLTNAPQILVKEADLIGAKVITDHCDCVECAFQAGEVVHMSWCLDLEDRGQVVLLGGLVNHQ